ncbi:hypothetical protein [Methanosalsum natronophilum]|uniref:hypothetical protein n=1 Tax=Methanosalsum natronophilum TaxID=768733 RepID=UPI002166E25B|nr:hypothetical protein [Methanosalsum natronophilum]MCS3924413.1 hypothetical protein [Methanosalsum natronophilum]
MVLIEGTAFPIGMINKNGWGIPSSEIENAVKSLLSSVVRVCTRDSEHGCDVTEDPRTEIGRVVDVWSTGDEIRIRADITDTLAQQKILEGTWEPTWSVYGKALSIEDEGWVNGYENRSVTLVRKPAWDEAKFNIVASKTEPELEPNQLFFSSKYTPIQSQSTGVDSMTKQTETETESESENIQPRVEELQRQLGEKERQITDLKEIEVSNTKLQSRVNELETVLASYEKDRATSVPMSKVNELIESKSNEIAAARIQDYKDELSRSLALEKLTAARQELNLDTKPDEYQHLNASELEKLAMEFEGIKVHASKNNVIQYPADSNQTATTVGRFDSVKKEWV